MKREILQVLSGMRKSLEKNSKNIMKLWNKPSKLP